MAETRHCERCNAPFIWRIRYARKRFCCRNCKDGASQRRRRANRRPPIAVHCESCGVLFLRKTSLKRFCSRRCLHRAARIRAGACAEVHHNCLYCGKALAAPKRKYCGAFCGRADWVRKPENLEAVRRMRSRYKRRHRAEINKYERAYRARRNARAAALTLERRERLRQLFKEVRT